jgi:hypothetical protein
MGMDCIGSFKSNYHTITDLGWVGPDIQRIGSISIIILFTV